MNLQYEDGQAFKEYIASNREAFHAHFQSESPNGFRYMEEMGLDTAELFAMIDTLFGILSDGSSNELIVNGKHLGRGAAKDDFPMVLILELVESFRKCLWDFLFQYHQSSPFNGDEVFKLERKYNNAIDRYLTHYVSSYMEYKEDILKSHRDAIDDLSVPVIPLSDIQAILPLVGMIDTHRAKRIQERVLSQIAELKMEHIIIDVSAVAFLDTAVVSHLFRIIDGIKLLGCKATITGIRPEIANTMIALGISLTEKVEIKGTLQQALKGEVLTE